MIFFFSSFSLHGELVISYSRSSVKYLSRKLRTVHRIILLSRYTQYQSGCSSNHLSVLGLRCFFFGSDTSIPQFLGVLAANNSQMHSWLLLSHITPPQGLWENMDWPLKHGDEMPDWGRGTIHEARTYILNQWQLYSFSIGTIYPLRS